MNMLDLVKSRRSVRTFDGHSLSREHAEKIMEYAKDADNPYDLPITWRILSAKKHGLSSPVIVGTDTYLSGKLRRVPHAEEAFGYAFENNKLRLHYEGAYTCDHIPATFVFQRFSVKFYD